MNCNKSQRLILLADSDELSARQQAALGRHLEACPDCRAYRQQTERLLSAARSALPETEPHPSTFVRIREAAEAGPPARLLRLSPMTVRALAAAAAVLVAVGLWFAKPPAQPLAKPVDTVASLGTVLTLVSDEDLEEPVTLGGDDRDARVRALAAQLLAIEGFAGDDFGDDLGLFRGSPGPEPTASRPRSIPVSQA